MLDNDILEMSKDPAYQMFAYLLPEDIELAIGLNNKTKDFKLYDKS